MDKSWTIWTKVGKCGQNWIIWTKVGQYGQKLDNMDKIRQDRQNCTRQYRQNRQKLESWTNHRQNWTVRLSVLKFFLKIETVQIYECSNNILKIVMYCSHPEFWAHFLLSDLHLCSSDYLMKQVKLIHAGNVKKLSG